MSEPLNGEAFGHPGAAPTWTFGNKSGVGTAYSAASRLWYTIWNGIVTEVYFPTVDRPQIRDLQLLFSDGSSVEDETSLNKTIQRVEGSLGYLITGQSEKGKLLVRERNHCGPSAALSASTRYGKGRQRDAATAESLRALCSAPRRRRLGQRCAGFRGP